MRKGILILTTVAAIGMSMIASEPAAAWDDNGYDCTAYPNLPCNFTCIINIQGSITVSKSVPSVVANALLECSNQMNFCPNVPGDGHYSCANAGVYESNGWGTCTIEADGVAWAVCGGF